MRYDIEPDDTSPEAQLCRVVNIMLALPPGARKPDATTPLRNVLPGAWPAYGDLIALAEKHFKKTV